MPAKKKKKTVAQARKETKELRASVKEMLEDRQRRGLSIPKSGRKLLKPKGGPVSQYVRKRNKALDYE